MLTEVAIQVAIVVAEIGPLKLTHSELGSELEGSFTNILLGNEALECLASDDERHFIRGGNPSRVAALGKSVRNGGRNDGVDKNQVAGTIKPSRTERLLVDAEGKPAITHELVAGDGLLTKLEAASGQVEQVFLDIGIVAQVLNLVGGSEDLEELAIFRRERLCKHLFAEEGSDAIEGLEVERGIGKDGRKLRVDLLHVASQILGERLGAIDHILDAGLDQILITDVGIDKLKDRLFERNLRLEVGTLEGGAGLLDANTGTGSTEGLELELILRGTNLVGSGTNAAKGGVIDEGRSGEGSGGNCHFLNNAADDIRNIRERAAVDGVDVWTFAGENSTDLSDDAVDILGGEVLDRGQGDTIVRHNFSFLFWFCCCLGFVLLEPTLRLENFGRHSSASHPLLDSCKLFDRPGTLGLLLRPVCRFF